MTSLPERDARRLRNVAAASGRIANYTALGRASLDDERTYDAVLRCLTIVGEALGALSDETYARLPSVPIGLTKQQRNLIVHKYWPVDPEVIWATVERDVPQLLGDVERVLARVAT
ncbi:HepT-like ribonuclease domain-containing protein [Demequina sp.]|uniref:HepT-like ribonuclease domain-containing protein n=1 Tax=Demequina sp. TaxID=2050685 RepID=UPI003D0C55A4